MPFLRLGGAKPDNARQPAISPVALKGLADPPSRIGSNQEEGPGSGLWTSCSNPACRSGWIRLWRSRSRPIFEDGWTCSMECTFARLQAAVVRELDMPRSARAEHRHRIPLGLLMMEQGWISRDQLRSALEAQKAAGTGRLGQWLIRQKATNEERVAKALGLQWSCPVFSGEHQEPATLAPAIPRLFLDALGALPLRIAGSRMLYLGFEQMLDPVLALAVERMTGLRVEGCIVREAQFRSAHMRMLEARFPSVELVEAVSPSAAARALTRSTERCRPVASRLVRVHDCLWLRLWLEGQNGPLPETDSVQDVVCSIGPVA